MASRTASPTGVRGLTTPFALLIDPLRTLENLRNTFGDVVRISCFGRNTWILARPDLVRHVMIVAADAYGKSLYNKQLVSVLGSGLITAEGDIWKEHREAIQQIFSHKRLGAMTIAMQAEVRSYFDELKRAVETQRTMALEAEMTRVTLRVFLRTLFGLRVMPNIEAFQRQANKLFRRVSIKSHLAVMLPGWATDLMDLGHRSSLAHIDKFLYALIEDAQTRAPPPDTLLAALMELYGGGKSLSDHTRLRDEMCTFLFAGHETAATTLSWALLFIMNDPEACRDLTAEADGNGEERPEAAANPAAYPLTRAYLNEVMRMFPPVWRTARQALRDDVVEGCEIRKGDLVLLPQYLIHRDSRYWEDPEVFNYRRFIVDPQGGHRHFSFLPFGVGPRICIGGQFAMTEMVLILAMILRTFSIQSATADGIAPKAMITLRPRRSVLGRLRSRRAGID